MSSFLILKKVQYYFIRYCTGIRRNIAEEDAPRQQLALLRSRDRGKTDVHGILTAKFDIGPGFRDIGRVA
jgi:hypothetical protein